MPLILSPWGHLGLLSLLNWPKWLTLTLPQALEIMHAPCSSGPRDNNAQVSAPSLLFPQHSTYTFITNSFTNKPSSMYANLRVPSVSQRNATWYTHIYTKHSGVPQEKLSRFRTIMVFCPKPQISIWYSPTVQLCPEMNELNIYFAHPPLCNDGREITLSRIIRNNGTQTAAICLLSLGRLLRAWDVECYLIIHWLCCRDFPPIVLQGP